MLLKIWMPNRLWKSEWQSLFSRKPNKSWNAVLEPWHLSKCLSRELLSVKKFLLGKCSTYLRCEAQRARLQHQLLAKIAFWSDISCMSQTQTFISQKDLTGRVLCMSTNVMPHGQDMTWLDCVRAIFLKTSRISLQILRSHNGHNTNPFQGITLALLKFNKDMNSWFLSWPLFEIPFMYHETTV